MGAVLRLGVLVGSAVVFDLGAEGMLRKLRNTILDYAADAILAAVVVIALACAACAADGPRQAIYCKVLYVHDGDTISADLELPFRVTLPNRQLRAFGYDAWEITRTRQTVKVTDEEITKGHKAREALQELLSTGILYVEDATAIQRVKPDPYGRMLTQWWVQQVSYPDGKPTVTWIDVAKWMKEHGHCRTPDSEGNE